MKEYKCIKKCFYNNRLYKVGEVIEGDCDSPHFVDKKLAPEEKTVEVKEPETYHELQQQQAREMLGDKGEEKPKKAVKK